VHGAGAVRSDPKSGNREDYPGHYVGFQGDIQTVFNYVRLVRDISMSDLDQSLSYPIVETGITVCYNDTHQVESCPTDGQPFYGQDGSFESEENSKAKSWTLIGLLTILGVALGSLVIMALGWLCFLNRWRFKGFEAVKDGPSGGKFQGELARLDSPHLIY